MRLLLAVFLLPSFVTCLIPSSTGNLRWYNIVSVESNLHRKWDYFVRNKIMVLNQSSSRFEQIISQRSARGTKDYLYNPLQAIALTRRLAEEWTALATVVHQNYGLAQLGVNISQWPSGDHIALGAYQVMRTQWTYGYETQALVHGLVAGKTAVSNVTAADCLHIGKSYWEHSHVEEAMEWFHQALHQTRLGDTTISPLQVMPHVMPYLCYNESNKSKHMELVKLLGKTVGNQLQSMNDTAWGECSSINYRINESTKQGILGEQMGEDNLEVHRQACRGLTGGILDRRLHCRYLHYSKPHLMIQPFKAEELSIDPPVLRFHQVITDAEADEMIAFVMKYLEVQVVDHKDGVDIFSKFRTTNGNWIYKDELEVNERLCRRMEDMTQLSLESAEDSKMTRYGSAGEFALHHDMIRDEPDLPWEDNRIAVLMFYLTDVREGGATIFPNLNLTVRPIKNSAILWFNVLPNGEFDERTKHAGCPVAWGYKWVLVKHIHHKGQEFIKPCGLHPGDSFTRYYTP